MNNFLKISDGLDVTPLLTAIQRQPDLWDRHTIRKTRPGSPHVQMSDIWVRFRPISELTSPEKFNEPHFAEFYPAWYALPEMASIVFRIMAQVKAVYLGGILITKIPPGGH